MADVGEEADRLVAGLRRAQARQSLKGTIDMGIPKTPAYARTWKARRQTRLKPSGMTALLEKWDKVWKGYDPQTFIREVMGTGENGLRDIQRNIDGFKKAEDEISNLAKAHDRDYNKSEKDVLKDLLADVAEELAFWQAKKKVYQAQEGGAKVAEDKMMKVSLALAAAMDKLDARAKQLDDLHGRLSAADKHEDRRAPPVALEALRKGAEAFETMLGEADALDVRLEQFDAQLRKSYAKDDDLMEAVGHVEKSRESHHKRLKTLRGERVVWYQWAKTQLAASPASPP
jgi:hypothetical protein